MKGLIMHRRFTFLTGLGLLVLGASLSGCLPRIDAIAVSQDQLFIDLSTAPQSMEVWNTSASFDPLTIDVSVNVPWMTVEPREVSSAAPAGANDYDRRLIRVSVDRRMLTIGTFEGVISFHAPRAYPKETRVRVKQNYNGSLDALRIVNPVHTYSSPYLLDFSFMLRDANDRPVVAAPEQIAVTAFEGTQPVEEDETGVHLRRGLARQLKVDLVLDYTRSMQNQEGAIAAMENAALNVLLPTLNEDALVGVWEFHRDDRSAGHVADFTADRDYVRAQVGNIQRDFVQGFATASKLWEAALDSVRGFGEAQSLPEARYIIVFSDGRDTSSLADAATVVRAAKDREVHIYTIGVGANINTAELTYLADSTGGDFFSAESISAFDAAFTRVVEDLGGQYVLRWASLRRNDTLQFKPSFTIGLGNNNVTYFGTQVFRPSLYQGDVTQGRLRLVASEGQNNATVFLRADYVPYNIRVLRMYLHATAPFTVQKVSSSDDGLVGSWTLSKAVHTPTGGVWLQLQSTGTPIPFATFGPLLRLDFGAFEGDVSGLIDAVYVDNSLYPAQQSFVVEGYANTPPGE
jgi:hypothetical protein